jgi:hypothetical protein
VRPGDRVEPVGVRGAAVEEQPPGRRPAAPLEGVEREAAGLDPAMAGGVAREETAHGGPSYPRGVGPGPPNAPPTGRGEARVVPARPRWP